MSGKVYLQYEIFCLRVDVYFKLALYAVYHSLIVPFVPTKTNLSL